jgi:hypothetical protein
MPVTLPEAIGAYFDAANARDADGVCASFSSDAVVRDEGRDRSGLAAIRAWTEETGRRYRPVVEPLECQPLGDEEIVRCKVSGDFPGSPVTLRHAFTLREGKITRLEITG